MLEILTDFLVFIDSFAAIPINIDAAPCSCPASLFKISYF